MAAAHKHNTGSVASIPGPFQEGSDRGRGAGHVDVEGSLRVLLAFPDRDDRGTLDKREIRVGFDREAIELFSQPGGVAQALGRFVERGASVAGQNPDVAVLSGASDDDSLWGITMRPIGEFAGIEGTGAQDPDTPDVVPAGNSLSVGYEGAINMRNVGSVASAAGGAMFGVILTAGGQQLGQARADADGGNTFAYSLQITRWIDVVLPGEIGRAFVRTI